MRPPSAPPAATPPALAPVAAPAGPPADASLWDGLAFVAAVAYSAWLAGAVLLFPAASFWPAWLAGVAIAVLSTRSSSPFFESVFIAVPWFLAGGAAHPNPAVLYLPLVPFVLIPAAVATRSRVLAGLVLPLCAGWFAGAGGLAAGAVGLWGVAILAATAVTLALFTGAALRGPGSPPRVVDLILNSASGNTAHYAQAFVTGLRAAGVEVREHRFHDPHEFRPTLDGDALVLAFPVGGWKPPWPLVAYLLLDLPRGRGKPAFCLYTAGGGPENAGLVAWLLLRLKGYRPVGGAWAVYPLNVVTFRLGTARLWRRLDRLVPLDLDLRLAAECGERFGRGLQAGLPLFVWAFPLFLAGFVLDNKWVNLVFYRNYAWRRRCTGCRLCVERCPSGRLRMLDGFPTARGTCDLCLLCVNLCPKKAMQMVGWTEYGNLYRPRWPRLLARRRTAAGDAGDAGATEVPAARTAGGPHPPDPVPGGPLARS